LGFPRAHFCSPSIVDHFEKNILIVTLINRFLLLKIVSTEQRCFAKPSNRAQRQGRSTRLVGETEEETETVQGQNGKR
jgi:hypothetical protein